MKDAGYQASSPEGSSVEVIVRSDSERLQLLSPFAPWDGKDFKGLILLLKAKGKCTTDHISMAGPGCVTGPSGQHFQQLLYRSDQRLQRSG